MTTGMVGPRAPRSVGAQRRQELPGAIIAVIAPGVPGPSRRTSAAAALARTSKASASADRRGTLAASIGS